MNWDDIGFLVGKNWGNAIVNRMTNKEQKDINNLINTYNNPTADEINAAQTKAGNGMLGSTPMNLVIKAKQDYELAKKQGNKAGMNYAMQLADTARTMGANMGIDMAGYGADNTLSSVYDLQAQKNGYPSQAKSNNIGNGLYVNQNNGSSTIDEPKGMFESALDKYSAVPPDKSESSGLLGNIDWQNIAPKPKTKEEILAGYRDDNNSKITLADLSKATGVDYEAKAQELANQAAKLRLMDPNYANNIENMLIDKGYRPELIDKVMGRVKENAKQVQSEGLLTSYLNNYKNGDLIESAKDLSRLGTLDPVMARTIGVQMPSFKDNFNIDTARKNAEIQQGYALDKMRVAQKYAVDKMGVAHTLSEDAADNNVIRNKNLAQFTANLQRNFKNLSMQDRIATLEALGLPKEAIQMSISGIKTGGGNSNGVNPQFKFALEQAGRTVTAAQKWLEMNPDKELKDYPQYNQVKVAQAIQNQYWENINGGNNGGEGSGGGIQNKEYDPNNYNDVMSDVTRKLTANKMKGDLSREEMERFIDLKYGDFAPKIKEDIDWGEWGFGTKPNIDLYSQNGGD